MALEYQSNVLGYTTEEMITQPLLKGKEYIVNTVSCQGIHYVSDIRASSKKFIDGRFIYNNEVLLPSEGEIQKLLIDYINKVLNTLGIKNGPSHSEVMLTDKGPVLIEVNPRVHGGILTSADDECLGHNQMDLTLDAFINPARFLEYAKESYQLKKEMMLFVAINEREGILIDVPELSDFKKIESYRFHRMRVTKGNQIKKNRGFSDFFCFCLFGCK